MVTTDRAIDSQTGQEVKTNPEPIQMDRYTTKFVKIIEDGPERCCSLYH